ncbi:hypothetical protein COLO4_33440 [Corchorus olitorius]|uniref:Uncharacterized protein n=1 Tax=Corchorus olitorius TaxID=93759 RepID=A0A1R3GTL8_9ROSI|nr:hypothetical protein COLO4_33440 [Corchorus olitorius]
MAKNEIFGVEVSRPYEFRRANIKSNMGQSKIA